MKMPIVKLATTSPNPKSFLILSSTPEGAEDEKDALRVRNPLKKVSHHRYRFDQF